MAINKLTARQVQGAKPGPRPVKLFDGGGLYLAVLPGGGKSWRLQYRRDGKQQTATLGRYPDMTLADARAAREAASQALAEGEAVGKVRRPTFAALMAQYWDGRQDIGPTYRQNATRGLERWAVPAIGDRPVDTVTRQDIMAILDTMNAAGKLVYLRKVKRWAGEVFDYAVEHGHCRGNPCAGIKTDKAYPRRPEQSHAALRLNEVGEFMRRLDLEPMLLSASACRLLALTWARTGELRAMRWDEIEGDVWRIPGDRMKVRRGGRKVDHLVPLSSHAMGVLDSLRARRVSDLVFPNDRRLDRPMSENAVLYLIGRIGYGGRMTGHGWRSVGSTWANEIGGYRPDVIERQLAHESDNRVRAVYNRAEYMPERRAMLQGFGDWLAAEASRRA